MPTKNDSGNSANLTKCLPFGSKLRISRICRLVIVLAGVKVALLAGMVMDSATPAPSAQPLASTSAPGKLPAGTGTSAVAASNPAAVQTLATKAAAAGLKLAAAPANPTATAQTPVSANAPTPGKPVQAELSVADALLQASANSARAIPRMLGNSVAYAADMPPMPEVAPPAPAVKPMGSPISPERTVNSNTGLAQPSALDGGPAVNAPAPTVAPFVSRDSAAQQQADYNRREQELMALQQQMESRMTELHGLENRIQGMLNEANTTQDSKFRQIVDMYANMKPRVAAQSLTLLDEDIAVKILSNMKPKDSGEIFSYMDPKNAARLSQGLAKMRL